MIMQKASKQIITAVLFFSLLQTHVASAMSVTGRLFMHGRVDAYDPTFQPPRTLPQMLKRYQTNRRVSYTQSYLIQGGEYAMKTIGTVGGAVFSGGNPVAGAVAGQVFGDAVGSIGGTMRNGIYKEMENYLDEGLKQVVLSTSRDAVKKATGLPVERARKLITEHPLIFDFKRLGAIRQEEKDLFQETAIEVLANKLAEETFDNDLQQLEIEANKQGIAGVQKRLDDQGKAVTNHINEYKRFSISITQNISVLAKSTLAIKNQVQVNMYHIKSNSRQINLLESSLFAKMSGQEKMQALQQGWFPDLSSNERSDQFRLAEEQHNMEETVQIIGTTAANLPAAMSLFTNDPQTLEAVTKASQLANGALAVLSASSMGPFGMAMVGLGALGGIFGRKGKDASAERHKQVMARFQTVIDNQIQISNQISEAHQSLAQGQSEIYDLLKNSALELVRLGKSLDAYHHEEMERLNLIRSYTLTNMDLLRDLAGREPKSCHQFFKTSLGQVSEIRQIDQFESFEQLEQHFKTYKDFFKSCQSGLYYLLTKQTYDFDIHSLLLTKSYTDVHNETEVIWATDRLYQPARKYYESVKGENAPTAYKDLIHTQVLRTYVGMALELYPYILIVDDPDKLNLITSKPEKRINTYAIQRAKKLLSGALTIINEAIFQQEIIAGHHWLGQFSSEMATVKDDARKTTLRQILEFNPFSQNNFARKLVNISAEQTNSPLMYYDSLLSGRQAYPFFTKFFGDRYVPEYQGDRWRINVGLTNTNGDLFLDLPTAEDVIDNHWSYSSDLVELHELRIKVINHLSWLKVM